MFIIKYKLFNVFFIISCFTNLCSCYQRQFPTRYKLVSVSAETKQIFYQYENAHLDTVVYFVVSINIIKKDDIKKEYSRYKDDYRLCVSENYRIKDMNIVLKNKGEKVKMEKIFLWKLGSENNKENEKIEKYIQSINECRNYRKTFCKIIFSIKKRAIKEKMHLEILLQNKKKLRKKISQFVEM